MNKINKNSLIGLVVSLIGLFIMGYSIGKTLTTKENNLGIVFGGLLIVFVGLFVVILSNRKKKQ